MITPIMKVNEFPPPPGRFYQLPNLKQFLLFELQIRHEIEVAKIGESGNYIEENDIPIKMFIAGPPQAGKTTLVRSVFDHESDANSFWNEKYICEDHKERTICLTQHYKRLFSNLPLLIYDLGGQECYYALHAVFLDLEDSFFLILVDISKEDYVLKESIKSQLSIISSKLRLHSKAEVLFIGTHADMLDEKQKREKINICKKTLMEAKNTYHNISIFRKKMYINATSKDSKELQEITIACEQLGNNVHKAMVRLKIVQFLFFVYDIKNESH